MSADRCLGAFTALGPMPPYLSVNQDSQTGRVTVIVRSPAQAHPSKRFLDCGPVASIEMSAEEFANTLIAIARNVRT